MKLLTTSTGCYQFTNTCLDLTVTVRVFEAAELASENGPVPMVAVTTYTTPTTKRIEHDILTPDKKRHCWDSAMDEVGINSSEFLAAVARAYWRTIA